MQATGRLAGRQAILRIWIIFNGEFILLIGSLFCLFSLWTNVGYILKIWWPNKITNKELWRKTNQEDITSTIKRRTWNWIGHPLRKDSATNITRQTVHYNPQGKRKRGRPKNNWRRFTQKDLETVGITWQEAKAMAQKRVRWGDMVDAICSQRGNKESVQWVILLIYQRLY